MSQVRGRGARHERETHLDRRLTRLSTMNGPIGAGSAAPPTTGATDRASGDDDAGLGDPCSGAQLPSGGQYAVTSGGAVWWDIGTPQLASGGGWVDTAFLAPVGGDDEQDSFDLEQAQIACVYEGVGDACDLLTTFCYPADQNYGLGNSMSQAPDAVLDAHCRAGDALACAEQASRGRE